MSKNQFVFLMGFLAGIAFTITAFKFFSTEQLITVSINYQFMKPVLKDFLGYAFIGIVFVACFQAIWPSAETVKVIHEEKTP